MAIEPGAAEPEALEPEAPVPEALVPEALVPEALVPEALVPGAGSASPPRRVRVDLAGRAARRTAYSRRELEEQTQVGDVLIRGLVRAQLGLALSLAAAVILLLGSLPIAFALFPALSDVRVFGLHLPWLLLGVLAYPLLYVVGRLHVRQAERIEDDFSKAIGTDT